MSTIIRRLAVAAAVLAVGLTVACSTPAEDTHAAPRVPVSDYDAGENPRDIGDWPTKRGTIIVDSQFAHKRWPVKKVVKQLRKQGVPVVAGICEPIVYDRLGEPVYSKMRPCITISSDRSNHTGPTGKRLGEVSLWSEDRVLIAADISLDDRDGKKASKKKRERKLRSYILQAAGR